MATSEFVYCKNLYIKNIADTVTDDRLREMFSPFGTVLVAKVSHVGGCKGVGAAGLHDRLNHLNVEGVTC